MAGKSNVATDAGPTPTDDKVKEDADAFPSTSDEDKEVKSESSSEGSPSETRRAILNTLRGSLGNLVEWYDVYVYTVFAKYFENNFFDSASKNATVYIYAIFAITFIMRPAGSVFFGRFADRHGRRKSLMVSVCVMAAASVVIAALPGRELIGIAAPILLILCRLVQVSQLRSLPLFHQQLILP